MKPTKRELFQCDVCRKRQMLASGKRHWCDCNPKAPFPMYSVRDRKIINSVLKRFRIKS